jgi:hypothetical protein
MTKPNKVKMVAFRSHLTPAGMVRRGDEFELSEQQAKQYTDRTHLAGPLDGEPEDRYAYWKKDDWKAEAERRQLTVVRTDGKDGDLRIEDYRAAIESADREKAR